MKTDSFVLAISRVSPRTSSGTPPLPRGLKKKKKLSSSGGDRENKKVKNTINQKVLLRKAAG